MEKRGENPKEHDRHHHQPCILQPLLMLYSGKNVSYILASALAWLLDCHSVMLKRRLRVMGKRMEERERPA